MNMQAIGKKIASLRKQRDMTQMDLADKLGVTYQAVSSWERGNSMPDIAKLPNMTTHHQNLLYCWHRLPHFLTAMTLGRLP